MIYQEDGARIRTDSSTRGSPTDFHTPKIEPIQNPLRNGFASRALPLTCATILEKVLREESDSKKVTYAAHLDAKSAFDVVDNCLLRKLFAVGVDGKIWTVFRDLHSNTESQWIFKRLLFFILAPCDSPLVTGPLGVEDFDLTTDLPYHPDPRCHPKAARMNAPWMHGFIGPYLQIRLRKPSKITGFMISGRSGFNFYVKSYNVKYSNDGTTWSTLMDANGSPKIFTGNTDMYSAASAVLETAINALYIRVTPVTCTSHCGLRFEILGCQLPLQGKQTCWKTTGATGIPTFDVFSTSKTDTAQCGKKCHKEDACEAFTFNPENGQCEGHSHDNYVMVTAQPSIVAGKQHPSLMFVRRETCP
ncbi:uncharacterized protein [Argopecten irradians]|uniref:uncharacterized protein n=1 Tax=Argopecten irradians TaxID=31199 RepID=UPI003715EDB1